MMTKPKPCWTLLRNIFELRASKGAMQLNIGINTYYEEIPAWQLLRSTTYQRLVSNYVFIFLQVTKVYVATSVDCKRAFSASGNIISKLRNSLKDDSARAACILNNWCRREKYLTNNEFQQRLHKGWSRGLKRPAETGSTDDPIEIE